MDVLRGGGHMTNKRQIKSQGFTLVELSIVIIIIGFLIAGIAAGQSLIQQAKLNAIIGEATNYRVALNEFVIRFNALPGDFKDAYAIFGSLPNADCTNNNISYDITGCNGDGDGIIDYQGSYHWYGEGLLAWKHLSLAGFITGNYIVDGDTVIGVNLPASKYDNVAGYHWTHDYLDGKAPLTLQIGADTPGDRPVGDVLTTVDASTVDIKIDDGEADAGTVRGNMYGYPPAGGGWNDDCTDHAGGYLVQTQGIICRLVFSYFSPLSD